MIPSFPTFRKIQIDDLHEITAFVNKYPPSSDFSFLGMWSYNVFNDLAISKLYDNLVVQFRDYITNEEFFSFLGNSNLKNTISSLLKLSLDQGKIQRIKHVVDTGGNLVNELSDSFEIIEDRDNFDYILSVEETATLKGSKFHNHRNFINRFFKLYPHTNITPINIKSETVQQQMMNVFNCWKKERGKADSETEHEFIALKRYLQLPCNYSNITVGVFDSNHLIGFITADMLRKIYSQAHFAKGDPKYIGIFYVLYNQLARYLQEKNYSFINNEQDMGIANLRYSKEQWNPVAYIKKYVIYNK